MKFNQRVWPIILLAFAIVSSRLPGATARYVARLQGGGFIEGMTLSDWHAPDVIPKLEGQPLLDPGNPFRWLVDRALPPPAEPEAFIEFLNGDRLPGWVFDYRRGDENDYSPLPPHLLVRYEGTNPGNLERQAVELRVDVRFVRRIVWQRNAAHADNRTAVLREGNRIRFRTLRFDRGSVSLLVENGVRRLSFVELAELHVSTDDYWPAYWDELLRLAPDGQRRLIQLETTTGLVATSSLDRYLPRAIGDVRDVNRWIHATQPAWCFDLIWVPQNTVWMRRSFVPHEVPLSRVPVSREVRRSPLGESAFRYRVNRNVAGGWLRGANRESGWGFGVHAFSELEFELPAVTRSFRTEIGIDASMRDGGCVQARVLNASAGNAPLYQGPILVGATGVLDTGPLGVSGSGDQGIRILLQVDPVLDNVPPNADPLDVRDRANWLEPIVELDPARLKPMFDARFRDAMIAWDGWDVSVEPGGQAKLAPFYAEAPSFLGSFEPAIGVTAAAIKIQRTVTPKSDDRWLVVDAVRSMSGSPPQKVAVKIGDQMAGEHEVPPYDKSQSEFRPVVIPLADDKGNRAASPLIEIRQLPTADASPIWWRSLAIVAQHPQYYRLLEDEAPGRADDTAAPERDGSQKHSGEFSFKIPAGGTWQMSTLQSISIREKPQLGEYRFLRFAVRKTGGGGWKVAVRHADDAVRAAVYEANANPPADPAVKRVANQVPAGEWIVVTRDLYGDFGNLELEGIAVEVVEGEFAWIDHVYLGRTQNDFNLIK